MTAVLLVLPLLRRNWGRQWGMRGALLVSGLSAAMLLSLCVVGMARLMEQPAERSYAVWFPSTGVATLDFTLPPPPCIEERAINDRPSTLPCGSDGGEAPSPGERPLPAESHDASESEKRRTWSALPQAPRPTKRIALAYPESPIDLGAVSVDVGLVLRVDDEGRVADVTVAWQVPPSLRWDRFSRSAVAAVRQWEFAPAAPGFYRITVKFRTE